jgi:hypothetical protein
VSAAKAPESPDAGLVERPDPIYEVAYLLWQVNQGYISAEDRAVGENWMYDDPAVMHPDDRASLPGWLDAAREVRAALLPSAGDEGGEAVGLIIDPDPGPTVREVDGCASCGEGDPNDECPKSKRPCGHHCNHIWESDACDWCGYVSEGDDSAFAAVHLALTNEGLIDPDADSDALVQFIVNRCAGVGHMARPASAPPVEGARPEEEARYVETEYDYEREDHEEGVVYVTGLPYRAEADGLVAAATTPEGASEMIAKMQARRGAALTPEGAEELPAGSKELPDLKLGAEEGAAGEALAWILLCAIYPEHQARTIRNFPCDDTWTDCQDQARAVLAAGYLSPAQAAAAVRAAEVRAWDECVRALAWCLDNGPASSAVEYLRTNNAPRARATWAGGE